MTTLLAFIFVFGLLVFAHELGHFLTAKFFGVRVDEFAFGFPPKLWSIKKGGTKYAINLIPFGGYVKLYGEEGEGNKKDSKNFLSKKAWQKSLILAAGVILNLVLAYLILTGFYLFGGKPLAAGMENHRNIIDTRRVEVTEVVAGTPAEKAGITAGAIIEKVDGTVVHGSDTVFDAVQKKTADNKTAQLMIEFSKDGQTSAKEVATYTEKAVSDGHEYEYQRIGIAMVDAGGIRSKWWAAPGIALTETGRLIKLTFEGFGSVISESFRNMKLSDQLGGPVAIYVLTGNAAKMGFGTLIQVVAILSITLAIINIMPFPALDGGHIFFILLEKAIRRPIPDKVKQAINLAGFCLLLLLIVLVSAKDLDRFGIFKAIKEFF